MDKFLEEMGASEEEQEKLQEVVSLLSNMQEELPSSSFQSSLKERLMQQAQEQKYHVDTGSAGHNRSSNDQENPVVQIPSSKEKKESGWKHYRPLFAVATAASVIVAMVLFSGYGAQLWGRDSADSDGSSGRIVAIRNLLKPPEISILTDKDELPDSDSENEHDLAIDPDRERETATQEQELEKDEQDSVSADDDQKEDVPTTDETPSKKEKSPEADSDTSDDEKTPAEEKDDGDEIDKAEQEKDEQEKDEQEKEKDPLSPEPEFEIWDQEQDIRLAGIVDLPELKYGKYDDEELDQVGNIEYSWRPGMIMEASVESVGTTDWAKKLLSGEGFTVSQNDALKIEEQETQKGKFVEIKFTPSRRSALPMVVYYQQDRGIISYYYQEKGDALEAGYYPLLSPSRAFEQVEDVPVYSEHERLDFSFRKVSLEYHEFTLKKDDREQSVKMPAYRFKGMEVTKGSEEIDIYLPAVKIP